MYRCYLIHRGRIAKAEDLAAPTLAQAIAEGHALLQRQPETTPDSGIEIWDGAIRLYSESRHAADTGTIASIESPFATAEPTMRPNRWLSKARPILAAA
jgi:hypothetical protein